MDVTDQRKNKRIPIIAEATVRCETSNNLINSYLINISYGGMGIYTKEPLSGRVMIAIGLFGDSAEKIVETLWGNVIWKKSIGLMYATGISFEGLNPKDHGLLLSFLERAMTVYDPN
jgi:hypothetical protein